MVLLLVMSLIGFGLAAGADDQILLVGAGSNVPTPLYKVWVEEFNKLDSKVQVRYLATSTSQSMRDISNGIGDFGAGEIPWSNEEAGAARSKILLVPTVLVSVVPIYNLAAGRKELHFTGDVLAKIFLGTIKNWNDPRIAKLNPDAALADLAITVVHRTEGKGSNYIFSEYLSKVSPEWKSRIGRTPSPKWPVGQSAQRGEDMIKKVKGTPGAIGYVELNFTVNAGAGVGTIQNAAGEFVKASPSSIAAAWRGIEKSAPANLRISMTNAPGKGAYPICSLTWLYVPMRGPSVARSHAMKSFLNWVLTDGQRTAQSHGYEPLPPSLSQKALARLSELP